MALLLNPAAHSSPGHRATSSFEPKTQDSFLLRLSLQAETGWPAAGSFLS